MTPEIHSLGHVALETPDLDASLYFFRDSVGLEEVARVDDTVYLRGVDEFDHHSLSLTAAEEPGVDHIGWQTVDHESIAGFADRLADRGIEVTWRDAGDELGQGESIRFEVPNGHVFELYAEMEKPEPPAERRSKLKNKTYISDETRSIAPRRIDHVQIWDPDAKACADWLQEVLGFRVQEYYDDADGSRWGTFVSACGTKIEAAVIQHDDETDPAALHHTAYKVDRGDDLFDAAAAMNERDIPTDGFGQHSISRGKFLYARDPATGHRIEFNAGGYLVFDPNWEPIAWQEGDLEDRQWIGGLHGDGKVSY